MVRCGYPLTVIDTESAKRMRRKIAFALIGLSAIIGVFVGKGLLFPKGPVPIGQLTPRPQGEGWLDLLDAAHASGWKNITDNKDIFEFKDGILHIFGRTLYPLRYVGYAPESFKDFDLHVEFKLAPKTNSGVFLRSRPNDPVSRGFEVQVLEDSGTPPNKNSCGAIYDVVTPMFNMSRPAGEWNSFDIAVQDRDVIVVMNGWMVVHTDFAKMTAPLGKFTIAYANLPLEGALALQDHGGEAWYRNILIRKR
jgi:hypothetical protein